MDFAVDTTIIAKLILASVLGGLIGLEREIHGRPAGFRTHLLVSLGSCLFVVTSIQFYRVFGNFSGVGPVGVDPGRVAAQVVTGIGFLGAGAIIRENNSIRGLTTAACLWIASAIGLSCGVGLYSVSLLVTVLSLISLLLLKKIENMLGRDTYLTVRICSDARDGQMTKIEAVLADCNFEVVNVNIERNLEIRELQLDYQVKITSRRMACDLVDRVATLDGIKRVALS
jgi:putative Mg2+ transporter-C (MgtC) family protein